MQSQQDLVESAVAWRRRIHRRPELGFQEEETAALVAEILDDLGLEVAAGIGTTGVVGSLRMGESDRSVGLRADIDAIGIDEQGDVAYRSEQPGVFHGCGHDGHTVMLLGAAARLTQEGGFDGAVHFIFQPCEEPGYGAQAMIDDGLFDRFPVDAVYGLHNMPGIPAGDFAVRPGPFMSFEDRFTIAIQGRGGHSSAPERSIDATVVGAEMVLALQTVVARSVSSLDPAVVSVTEFDTDGVRNVIASNATIRGDCRGFTDETSDLIETRIRELAAGIGSAHGATCTVDYERACIVVDNSDDETQHWVGAARAVVGEGRVDASANKIPASEDFARMLRVRPGSYALIGNGENPDSAHGCSLHNPFYDFNDAIIGTGIDYWVTLVRQQLPV